MAPQLIVLTAPPSPAADGPRLQIRPTRSISGFPAFREAGGLRASVGYDYGASLAWVAASRAIELC